MRNVAENLHCNIFLIHLSYRIDMMSSIEEKALVKRILNGQVDDFQIIIEKYQRLVVHIVHKLVIDRTECEDICQDVFLRAYQNLSTFQFKSKLSTWIGQIAYHRALNYLEKKKVVLYNDIQEDNFNIETVESKTELPDQYAENLDISEMLEKEISLLKPEYRTIISLYHLEEMTYNEISDITGLPEGTVKSHLFRARKQLKDRLLAKYAKEDVCL